MRIRGFVAALLMVMSATVFAQDHQDAVDPKDQEVTALKKQVEALMTQVKDLSKPKAPELTPVEQKQKAREAFAAAFKQARERAEPGCLDAGGKKITSITIDGAGKPSATCGF